MKSTHDILGVYNAPVTWCLTSDDTLELDRTLDKIKNVNKEFNDIVEEELQRLIPIPHINVYDVVSAINTAETLREYTRKLSQIRVSIREQEYKKHYARLKIKHGI